MIGPNETWPPPPAAPPPPQERLPGYGWTGAAVRVLLCYSVLWTCLFSAAQYFVNKFDFIFYVFAWETFVIQAFVLLGLHLPGLLLFQRLRRHAPPRITAAVSSVWGGALASVHWVLLNCLRGGYDSACDPDTGLINWGCGIIGYDVFPLLVAGSVTGSVVGCVLANRHVAPTGGDTPFPPP